MIESSDQAGLHSEGYISAILYPSYKNDTLKSLFYCLESDHRSCPHFIEWGGNYTRQNPWIWGLLKPFYNQKEEEEKVIL